MNLELLFLDCSVVVKKVNHILNNLSLVEVWRVRDLLIAFHRLLEVLESAEKLRILDFLDAFIKILFII